VAGVAILRCRGCGGEFVVVVLGVELQFVWTSGSHDGRVLEAYKMVRLECEAVLGRLTVFIVGAGVENGR